MTAIADRLAVCSWSLQSKNVEELIDQLKQIDLPRIQLAIDPLRDDPANWGDTGSKLADAGIEIVSGMFGGVGEDYSTMEAIKITGGVVPDETWPTMWDNIQGNVPIAKSLGLKLMTFHAGFLPEDHNDPTFERLNDRIEQIADAFGEEGIDVGFETGQETATTLKEFLDNLGKKNVGVNFDPANMILYDKGDPVEAINTLAPYLQQCHIKDATRTKEPGTWGEEVTTGTGEVDWNGFFAALDSAGFTGDLAIEREAGDQRIADIRTAKEFVSPISV